MTNKIYKTYVEKTGGTAATEYIGNQGEIFLDPNTSAVRVSDGLVPGGQVVSVQVVESLVNTKRINYENALANWKWMKSQETNHPGHPWFNWNITGENVDEYITELQIGWQVQNAPSSPPQAPSSPPLPNPNLIFVPAISSAYYAQLRTILIIIRDAYADYKSALQAKQIIGDSLTIPSILYSELDEDLIITVRYTSLISGGSDIIEEKQFKFSTNGTLTFPNGTVQTGAAIDLQYLKSIVASSADFNAFKATIAAL